MTLEHQVKKIKAETRLTRIAVLVELASFEAEEMAQDIAAIPGADPRAVHGVATQLTKIYLKMCEWADATKEGQEMPQIAGEWPEEFQCPHCKTWMAVDDDYTQVLCECNYIIHKSEVAEVRDAD